MKSIILTIALLVSTFSFAQGLSSSSESLKSKSPKEFSKIEALVQKHDKETDPIYNIMVNAQVKAREKVAKYIGTIKTKEGFSGIKKLMDMSQEVINGEEVFNWVLLATLLKV